MPSLSPHCLLTHPPPTPQPAQGPATEMLLAASEAVGPSFVAACLHRRAAAHKNPKVLTETLNFLAASLQDFGLAAFDVPALLEWAKLDLGSAVAGTRTAAIAMVGLR
jgi:cytoskeleton-associated protein 5